MGGVFVRMFSTRIPTAGGAVSPVLVAGLILVSCGQPSPTAAADWQPAKPAQRIVLASVLAAESVLDALPRERLAGVHAFAANAGYSLVAERAKDLRLLGATPEQLLSVRPDLVLVDAYTRGETLALLEAASVPVVRTIDPHGFSDIERNLRTLGRVMHLEAETDEIIGSMRNKLADVRASGDGLREWRLLSLDGALHTYGKGSLFDAIATTAGARNLAAEHGVGSFRKLDIEEVLAWRPDAIVLSGSQSEGGGVPKWIQQFPGLNLLPCVKSGRLVFVPGPLLSTTSHHLVDAAAFVQKKLRTWGKP